MTNEPTIGPRRNVHPYAHRYAAKTRAEIQKEESREWTVLSKRGNECGNDMPALSTRLTKNAIDEEARSALPRGSVIQQNMTKLASIATRSIAARTLNRVTDGRSLLHWQTSCRDQNCSHSNTELCDGWALSAAMALHSGSTVSAQHPAHPRADS